MSHRLLVVGLALGALLLTATASGGVLNEGPAPSLQRRRLLNRLVSGERRTDAGGPSPAVHSARHPTRSLRTRGLYRAYVRSTGSTSQPSRRRSDQARRDRPDGRGADPQPAAPTATAGTRARSASRSPAPTRPPGSRAAPRRPTRARSSGASVAGAARMRRQLASGGAFSLKYDASGRSVDASASRAPDKDGWYTGPVSFSVSGIGRRLRPRLVQRAELRRARHWRGRSPRRAATARATQRLAPVSVRYDSTRPEATGAALDRRPTTASGSRSPSRSRSPGATRPPGSRPAPR